MTQEEAAKRLSQAVLANDPEGIRQAVAAGADVNGIDEYDRMTVLQRAVYGDRLEAFKTLLALGAEVDATTKQEPDTALFLVHRHGCDTLTLALQAGADTERRDRSGNTPLLSACRDKENAWRLRALLGAGADVRARNDAGDEPVHVAVRHHASTEMLALLLDAGADPNARGHHDRTALHEAALVNNVEALLLLSARGADLEVVDDRGCRPLQIAAARCFTRMANAFVALGASVLGVFSFEDKINDDLLRSPLECAVRSKNEGVLRRCLLLHRDFPPKVIKQAITDARRRQMTEFEPLLRSLIARSHAVVALEEACPSPTA